MHQKAVVHLGEGIDGVDVGRQEQRRLRLAQRDDVFGAQPSQNFLIPCQPPAWEKMSYAWASPG
jgi:hypothetical protein